MMHGCRYIGLFILLLLLNETQANDLELTKQDAGVTIKEGKVSGVRAEVFQGINDGSPYKSCSFKPGETIYSIDHSENPAILAITDNTDNFTVKIDNTLIATNTEDETPTQNHAIFLKNNEQNDKQTTVNLEKNAHLIGAIKEKSSVPVLQIESDTATIDNKGIIDAQGETEKIAVLVQQAKNEKGTLVGGTNQTTVNNFGIINGNLVYSAKDNSKLTIHNSKEINAEIISANTVNNTGREAILTVEKIFPLEKPKDTDTNTASEKPEDTDTNTASEKLEDTDTNTTINNSGQLTIKSVDLSQGDIIINNKAYGTTEISNRIRLGKKKFIINNDSAGTIRFYEGSTVHELHNKGKVQIVLYQAKQRNAVLLKVEDKNKYSNTGTIEIDAIEGGMKVAGLQKEVPVIMLVDLENKYSKSAANSEASVAPSKVSKELNINLVSKQPSLVEIHNPKQNSTGTVLFCDLNILPISQVYTTLEKGFSAVDAQLADALQMANTSAKKITSIHGGIFPVLDTQDSEQLKQYLTEIRPDDVGSIALVSYQSSVMLMNRIKARLEEKRKKNKRTIYWQQKRQYNFWIQAAYQLYDIKADHLTATLENSNKIRAAAIGMDTKIFNDNTLIGLMLGYARAGQTYNRVQEVQMHNLVVSLYASYYFNNKTYVDAAFFMGKATGKNTRMEGEVQLKGNNNLPQLGANVFLGTSLEFKKFVIDPKIGLQFNLLSFKGYQLKNTDDSLIESHQANNLNRLDGVLGVKVSYRFDYNKMQILPSIGIGGIFKFKKPEVDHKVVFANTSYDMNYSLGADKYLDLEAGVTLKYRKSICEINYNRSMNKDFKSQEFQFKFRFKI